MFHVILIVWRKWDLSQIAINTFFSKLVYWKKSIVHEDVNAVNYFMEFR